MACPRGVDSPCHLCELRLCPDEAESAPTVPIVPGYFDPAGLRLMKPVNELFATDVMSHRSGQVIVDDVVNLAKREPRNVAEVFCIKQPATEARSIERA